MPNNFFSSVGHKHGKTFRPSTILVVLRDNDSNKRISLSRVYKVNNLSRVHQRHRMIRFLQLYRVLQPLLPPLEANWVLVG